MHARSLGPIGIRPQGDAVAGVHNQVVVPNDLERTTLRFQGFTRHHVGATLLDLLSSCGIPLLPKMFRPSAHIRRVSAAVVYSAASAARSMVAR